MAASEPSSAALHSLPPSGIAKRSEFGRFRQRLTPQEVQAAWQEAEHDLAAGILVSRVGLWHRTLREAESLAENHTASTGSRILDIIHVAAASVLKTSEFCTFDTRQADLARRAGLSLSKL